VRLAISAFAANRDAKTIGLGSFISFFLLFSIVSVSQLFGALYIPRTDAGEMGRRDSGDVTGNVPHCRRWIDSIRSEIDSRQALQEIRGAAFGHARVTVNHHVFAQAFRIDFIAAQRQRDSRVAPTFLTFLCSAMWPIMNSSFSIPTHTTVTCGPPSELSVVK
jgi:hypothetical protein